MALSKRQYLGQGSCPYRRQHQYSENPALYNPYCNSVRAEGMAQHSDLGGALDLLDGCIAQADRPAWEERHYYAEALRIRGWLLVRRGDPAAAERTYIASLDWARTHRRNPGSCAPR
jgi:hypothetical protein